MRPPPRDRAIDLRYSLHELIVGRNSMANAMLDAREEGDSYRRIEVITGQRQRRRWTAQEKARIVAESFDEGANISEVARRNGVARGLLTVWRQKLAAAAGANARGFVPVRIASEGCFATAGGPGRGAPLRTMPRGMAAPPGQILGEVGVEVSG